MKPINSMFLQHQSLSAANSIVVVMSRYGLTDRALADTSVENTLFSADANSIDSDGEESLYFDFKKPREQPVWPGPPPKLRSIQSVILPSTGERVRRTLSQFSEFESFDARGFNVENGDTAGAQPLALGRGQRGHGEASRANGVFKNSGDNGDDEGAPLLPNGPQEPIGTHGGAGSAGSAVHWWFPVRRPSTSEVASWLVATYHDEKFRSVLKCSIAYVIASLGVYWESFYRLLGDADSKHVIATVAVYFHPSRTKGSMTQSIMFVFISLAFSFTLEFLCGFVLGMFISHGRLQVSYGIDLVTASIALGIVAFYKQKINKPTFNTACSLASISIVAGLKEGSSEASATPVERVTGTLVVVLTGCTISVLCCYFIWPVSAVDHLRKHLNDSFNIFSALLSITTSRFINGTKLTSKDIEYFNNLNKNILSLNALLEEAKFELLIAGKKKEWKVLEKLVSATKALARHIQALRSSVEMQRLVLEEVVTGGYSSDSSSFTRGSSRGTSILGDLTQSIENLSSIQIRSGYLGVENQDRLTFHPQKIFELFVYHLAPSIKSFVFTVKSILSEIPFEKDDNSHFIRSATFQTSLERAIMLYQEKQAESFRRLYTQDIFNNPNPDDRSEVEFHFKTDQEEVAACCGNFSSLMVEFAAELNRFLEITESYEDASQSSRSWSFLWNSEEDAPDDSFNQTDNNNSCEDSPQPLSPVSRHSPGRNFGHVESTLNAALLVFQEQYKPKAKAKPKLKISPSISWRPPTETIVEKDVSFKIWKTLRVFKRTDVQFGIRVGLGAFFLSIFAFLPFSERFFKEWRIEWAIVVYCIMMSKSVGGTTLTIRYRIIGTLFGCYGAYLVWWLTDGNVYFLCLSGFLLSLVSFYIIIYWKGNNAFGRFILLAYNITALYSYSMSNDRPEDGLEGGDNPIIGDIAFHRFTAVTIGIVFSLTMSTLFLPNSARSRLKKGLSILWLRMGVIWNSDPLDYTTEQGFAEAGRLIGLKDQKGLYDILIELETLLKQAPNEFRLKGQFPKDIYEKLLLSTSNIIDAFLNMNLMIEVDTSLSYNEEYVLQYINEERMEVEHRIFLVFYMVASALRLGFPVPSKPASTEHAKDKMLYKLNKIRYVKDVDLTLTDEDYVLLYTYILVTNRISQELEKILELVKDLLGEIDEEIFHLV